MQSQELIAAEVKDEVAINFFPISLPRLALLFILTGGFYQYYWFYKNFQSKEKANQFSGSALIQTILLIFFCYSLFKAVSVSAKVKDVESTYHVGILTTFYILWILFTNGMYRIPADHSQLLLLPILMHSLSFLLLLPVQIVINNINKKENDTFTRKKSTWGERIFVTIFVIFNLLVLISIFFIN